MAPLLQIETEVFHRLRSDESIVVTVLAFGQLRLDVYVDWNPMLLHVLLHMPILQSGQGFFPKTSEGQHRYDGSLPKVCDIEQSCELLRLRCLVFVHHSGFKGLLELDVDSVDLVEGSDVLDCSMNPSRAETVVLQIGQVFLQKPGVVLKLELISYVSTVLDIADDHIGGMTEEAAVDCNIVCVGVETHRAAGAIAKEVASHSDKRLVVENVWYEDGSGRGE